MVSRRSGYQQISRAFGILLPPQVYSSIKVVGLILLCCAGANRPAMAQGPPDTHAGWHHGPSNWANDLQLSADQKDQFTKLEAQGQNDRRDLFKELHDLRTQLSAVYHEYDIDVRRARSLNDQLNNVQARLLDLHLIEQQKLRKILTSSQFAKLQADIDQQREQERHEHGPSDHEWSH
jgi:Spy/CpxP family protein refolding chaperone